MSPSKTERTDSDKAPKKSKDRAAEIANTFEWLITAFILAFVFRAFVMEAFRIPTGSMADTLKGAHFRLRCRQCGYKYDHGFVPERYRLPQDTIPDRNVSLPRTRCPSCGYYQPAGGAMPVANGDRILVLKCIYQFFEPKQWDVIVFKNPLDPSENYIKRLVGRPGETVEIIDGDVYINGQISRKPPKVQNELWMPVYNNDYQPVNPYAPSFNNHQWDQPFRTGISQWKIDKASPTLFHLDSPAEQINTLFYDTTDDTNNDTKGGNDFRATYAYDDVEEYKNMPYCSDLMVRFYCLANDPDGSIGISLSKYETTYQAKVYFSIGVVIITKQEKGKEPVELTALSIKHPTMNKHTLVKFANVDHQLVFKFGSEKLTYDLGRAPESAGEIRTDIQPQVEIFGSGKLTLSHVAIFRDIHYTEAKFLNSPERGRATKDNPFILGKDEFFVLGDNSPNSEDGRWWSRPGIANKGQHPYNEGVVPRDYLVGKALFVYWPSGFEFPWPVSLKSFLLKTGQHNPLSRAMYWIVSWKWIPSIGQMRFIYGGSDENS